MTQLEFLTFARDLFDSMIKTIEEKNSDYTAGGSAFSNFEGAREWGVDPLIGLMLRFEDKVQRLKSFFKTGTLRVKNEGVTDAMRDIIGYMTIALGILEEQQKKSVQLNQE